MALLILGMDFRDAVRFARLADRMLLQKLGPLHRGVV